MTLPLTVLPYTNNSLLLVPLLRSVIQYHAQGIDDRKIALSTRRMKTLKYVDWPKDVQAARLALREAHWVRREGYKSSHAGRWFRDKERMSRLNRMSRDIVLRIKHDEESKPSTARSGAWTGKIDMFAYRFYCQEP